MQVFGCCVCFNFNSEKMEEKMEEKKEGGQKEFEMKQKEEKKEEQTEKKEKKKKFHLNLKSKETQNIILAVTVALAIFVAVTAGAWFSYQKKNYIGEKKAKDQTEKFIKDNLLPEGGAMEIKGVTKKEGLYEIKLVVGGTEYLSYLTSNGEIFFPQGMNVKETEDAAKAQKEAQDKAMNVEIPKTDKPVVEVFIMSYCPFGTQMQKGVIPVMEALKDKADIEFKYVSYAMHGDKEIDENMNQYCISQKEPNKYLNYLKCFLKAGDSKTCLASEKINQVLMAGCVKEIDTKFEIKKKAADKASWSGGQYPPFDLQKADNEKYKVQGSPTLIINGTEVPVSQRDPNNLLKKVCSAFTVAPKECESALSSQAPASGFGEGAAAGADASAAAGCAQ